MQIGDPTSNPTTVKQLPDDTDYRPFLKSIKTSTDNCMILHCSLEKIPEILNQANDLKMLGEYQVRQQKKSTLAAKQKSTLVANKKLLAKAHHIFAYRVYSYPLWTRTL